MKESYKNSQKNGKWLVWYENGQMKIEGDYKKNKKVASGLIGIPGVGILKRLVTGMIIHILFYGLMISRKVHKVIIAVDLKIKSGCGGVVKVF